MPHGGPNLGKTASVISAVLPHALLLFVQRVVPRRTSKDLWSHRWSWFPATYLARQVGGSLARTRERKKRVTFIAIFIIDGSINYGSQEEA